MLKDFIMLSVLLLLLETLIGNSIDLVALGISSVIGSVLLKLIKK